MTCAEVGCDKGPNTTGDALYRISPKGKKFIGKCEQHYTGPMDLVVKAIVDTIEEDNERLP